jgi:hypothetical protein
MVALPPGARWLAWLLIVAFSVASTVVARQGFPSNKRPALSFYSEWRMLASLAMAMGFVVLIILTKILR